MAVITGTSKQFNNSLDALKGGAELTHFMHPDYRYYKTDWDMIRDCIAGSRRIKEKGEIYLPSLGEGGKEDYETYKKRAVFTNLTSRTIGGWLGTVFRRPIKVDGIADTKRKRLDEITADGTSANAYAKKLLQELLAIGRIGVLVDRDPLGRNVSYAATYLAENILSWRTKMVDGKLVLTYVLLREIVEARAYLDDPGQAKSEAVQKAVGAERATVLRPRYRVCRLDDNGNYVQDIYAFEDTTNSRTPNGFKLVEGNIMPLWNGSPFKEIPFWIAGPNGLDFNVQKAPAYDIAEINIAHYKTSAQLEHGRFFTALPVYYVQQAPGSDEESEYTIGPSVVWEVPADAKPGILEYYGNGLKTLADSLVEKETHIEQLGGRIAGAGARVQGSDNADVFAAKQSNETSTLLAATDAVGDLLTKVIRFMMKWENIDGADKVVVRLNQDFKLQSVGARELRAVALLYQSGILPVDDLYRVLQESEYIGEEVTLDAFKKKLDDLAQFPNQPDVAAMHEGYPDAATKFKVEEGVEVRDHEVNLQDNQGELDMEATIQQQNFERQEAAKDRKSDEKKAKDTAKAAAATAKVAGKAKPAAKAKK